MCAMRYVIYSTLIKPIKYAAYTPTHMYIPTYKHTYLHTTLTNRVHNLQINFYATLVWPTLKASKRQAANKPKTKQKKISKQHENKEESKKSGKSGVKIWQLTSANTATKPK